MKNCFLIVVGVALLAGCNRGPKCYPVGGKVTWNGEPVTVGNVAFHSTSGGRPATSKIKGDGTYVLSSYAQGDGAQAGAYKVTIESVEYPKSNVVEPKTFEEELAQEHAAPQPAPPSLEPKWFVPEEYSFPETSPLTATVAKQTNQIDFELP